MNRHLLGVISTMLALGGGALFGQAPNPDSQNNPTGNTGALKTQITTGGSYDAHSGNGTRIVTDLQVPGALGVYGLDFTRYWNSLPIDRDDPNATAPGDFGVSAGPIRGDGALSMEKNSRNTYPVVTAMTTPTRHRLALLSLMATRFSTRLPALAPPSSGREILATVPRIVPVR